MNAYNPETSALSAPQAETAKILVIRFKHIGDVLLTSVLCNTLKQTFPKARVDFLMQDTSVGLFEHHPFIDRVIGLTAKQRRNPFQYWRTIRQLTAERYDLVVDAQSTTKSELISLLARNNAICIGRKKPRRGFFYTHTIAAKPTAAHKIEERLALLEPLRRMGFNIKRHDQMMINVPEHRRAHFRNELLKRGVDFSRPLFAFSVTAKLDYKKWRLEHLAHVMRYCMKTFDAQIVFNAGSDRERAEVNDFVQSTGINAGIYCDLVTTTLMDLAALFTNCDLYIGNEGGPRHIAQAVGVPSVSVFSPSAKKSEWLPSNSRHHQGIEWDDLVDDSAEAKIREHQALQIGSKRYAELYAKITPQPVISMIDDVTEFVGIRRHD